MQSRLGRRDPVPAEAPAVGPRDGRDGASGIHSANAVVREIGDEEVTVTVHGHACEGLPNLASVAGPPSPLKPSSPVPATVVMVPVGSTKRIRWLNLSAM